MDYFEEPNSNLMSPLGMCLCSACWGNCAGGCSGSCKGCKGCQGQCEGCRGAKH